MGRMSAVEITEEPVTVILGRISLQGYLGLPERPRGVVLFAHGSGSGRHSPRNCYVARLLRDAGLGTLLIDLLTEDEDEDDQYNRRLRFDIGLLADRLAGATDWLINDARTHHLKVGYFGASTGGGAALVAASKYPHEVGAIVSRGGRPDMAGAALAHVHQPTLLIVGGDDSDVIVMNQEALPRLAAPIKQFVIVPGASHLFEEPGTLDEVARLTTDWFIRHLPGESEAMETFLASR